MDARKGAVTNIQLAAEVAKDVEFRSIVLRKATVESLVDMEDDLAKLDINKLEAKMQMSAGATRNGGRITVSMRFQLELLYPGEPPRSVLRIDAEYVLRYGVPADAQYSEAAVRYFADLNGAVHSWPYWRELVNTAASRAGLGAITIPVFRPQRRVVKEAAPQAGK